jgi:hypothetical protein
MGKGQASAKKQSFRGDRQIDRHFGHYGGWTDGKLDCIVR